MDRVYTELTVLFEEPFWIGVFSRISEGKMSVAKVTFGSEPKEYEVEEMYLQNCYGLRFSPAVEVAVKELKHNPKKRKRDAGRMMQEKGIGTKSQQALKLQREQGKTEKKQKSREEKEAENNRLFELKQLKRKEKHKGR